MEMEKSNLEKILIQGQMTTDSMMSLFWDDFLQILWNKKQSTSNYAFVFVIQGNTDLSFKLCHKFHGMFWIQAYIQDSQHPSPLIAVSLANVPVNVVFQWSKHVASTFARRVRLAPLWLGNYTYSHNGRARQD